MGYDHFYKNTNHQLYAIDKEPIQINALRRRIEKIESTSDIEFSTIEFPTIEFSKIIFSGVIVSNLLHFMDLNQAEKFIEKIEKQISKGSILLFTCHSWKHSSNGNFDYFKHYFRKKDFYHLLPNSKYEYLYFDQKTAAKSEKHISFIKEWLKLCHHHYNYFNDEKISKAQIKYLNESKFTENMTVVVKRK